MEEKADGGAVTKDGFTVTEGTRRYVLTILFLVYCFNFVDRQILTILIEPIKNEFGFSDTQLGVLGGLAFALLYSTLGISIARWADRTSRVNIISAALFTWSLFTALTGLARSFWHFLIARVLVGVGEAGCSPPAYALISDYFPTARRATALSIYSMGIYGGVCIGFLVGGNVALHYGWRAAFGVVGLPGLLLAVILRATLREPPRGFSDNVKVVRELPPTLLVLRNLWAKRSFRHMSVAAALHAFVGYGVGGFTPPFLIRVHGMTVAEVGNWLSFIMVAGGLVGTYLGGKISDRQAHQTGDRRHYLWVPAIAILFNVPFGLAVYLLPAKHAVLFLMIPTWAFNAAYLGPTLAMTQGLVGIRERALAGALLLFIINLIGIGIGPTMTGVLSDVFRGMVLATNGETVATAQGLRYALCVTGLVNFWSLAHYVLAARTIREDLDSVKTA